VSKLQHEYIKYEFKHGRTELVFLYSTLFGVIFTRITLSAISAIPFFDALFQHSVVFAMISVMIPFFSPLLLILISPPEKLNINVKCVGILYEDYVEIHKGKRIISQRYEDINRIQELRGGFNLYWRIGKVSISEVVGFRKKHMDSEEQLLSFIYATEYMVIRAKE
jgi:hypothetical protein